MQTKEYHSENKSEWADGIWKQEPDKLQWADPATGLPCLIVRGPAGALCGYVAVPESHPWYGKSYLEPIGDCTENCSPQSHCSHNVGAAIIVRQSPMNFDRCADVEDESRHICHVPDPGESDHVWWFGFDCAHAGDLCPRYLHDFGPLLAFETYRDVPYVREQVTRLATQLAAVSFSSGCGA